MHCCGFVNRLNCQCKMIGPYPEIAGGNFKGAL